MLSGHVTVPINPAQDIETAAYIMEHSDSKLVFAGGLQYADRFFEALPDGVFSVGMSGSVVQTDETLDGLISRYEAGRTFAPGERMRLQRSSIRQVRLVHPRVLFIPSDRYRTRVP